MVRLDFWKNDIFGKNFWNKNFWKKIFYSEIQIPFLCDLDYLNLSPAGWYFPNLLWSFLAKALFQYYFFQLISYLFGLGLDYLFVILSLIIKNGLGLAFQFVYIVIMQFVFKDLLQIKYFSSLEWRWSSCNSRAPHKRSGEE